MAVNSIFKSLLNQAAKSESHATVLKPLACIIGLILSTTLTAFYINAATWLIIVLAIFSGLAMSIYLIAYLYLLFKDRDSLRSENYSLRKLQIQATTESEVSNLDNRQ